MEELIRERDKTLNSLGFQNAIIEEAEGERAILRDALIEITKQIKEAEKEEEQQIKDDFTKHEELLRNGDASDLSKAWRKCNSCIYTLRKGKHPKLEDHDVYHQRREILEAMLIEETTEKEK